MNNAYQYCTRCGDELSETMKAKYAEEHQGGPVLCRTCLVEILHQIPEALAPAFRALNEMMETIAKNTVEALSAKNEGKQE